MRIPYGFVLISGGTLRVNEYEANIVSMIFEFYMAGASLGKVVDMLYFPFIEDAHYPSWIPWLGGKEFTFFSPVFNIADMSISTGLIIILLFQKRFFKQQAETEKHHTIETKTPVNDEAQIL